MDSVRHMISQRTSATFLISILGVALSGCVSSGRYQRTVAELEETQKSAARVEKEQRAQIAALQQRIDELSALEAELAELGQSAANLDDARKLLEELKKQKLAAEERAMLSNMLAKKLHSMIDAGDLTVTIRDDRMVLALPSDVLFDSGKTDVKEGARRALEQVAQVLASIEGRHYQVVGHTDNVPIHTRAFPSNWELSTQRALVVTKLLIETGLGPERLSAAGYGEYDPVSPNDSDEGRAANRRIEITVLPKIEELPEVEDVG